MREPVRSGVGQPGGITGYPLEQLHEEVAFIGYYLHWSHDQIMDMEHSERRKWCEEVSKINRRLKQGGGPGPRPIETFDMGGLR